MAIDDRQTNNEELLHMAIKAAKSGQRDGARMLFRQLYGRDKRNETVLLWLARVARSQKERIQWLERVLELNPENEAATKALQRMNYRREAIENRTLLLFGGMAAIMVIMTLFILFIAFTS